MIDPGGWPGGVAATADRERFARYAEALSFYQGEQWTRAARRGETRLTLNYARTLVRKTAAYVFPAPVLFSVPEQGDAAVANRAERVLTELAAELDLARLDVELCIDGAVLGDTAIKVTWDAVATRPCVAPVDPATLVVTPAPDNPRRMIEVTQVYALSGAAIGELFWPVPDGVGGSGCGVRGGGSRGPNGLTGLLPDRAYPVVETWTAERWRVTVAGQTVRDGRTRTVGFRT